MAEDSALARGTLVRVISGKHEGASGRVFWSGENRYGPGTRYGIRTDEDETYWVTDSQIEEVDEEPREAAELEIGDAAEIVVGPDTGVVGTVFWVGDSKFGPGQRYGLKDDDGETYWADARDVQRA